MSHNKKVPYQAKPVDADGNASYSAAENAVWQQLFKRQIEIVKDRACPEYLEGLKQLELPPDRVPQCSEVSKALAAATGWRLEPVPALISFDRFFELLATQRFPAATFIRRQEDLDYIQEPDIFHEIFGHSPLLTNPAYAEFTHTYGCMGLKASPAERILLARLYWFTVEFGLIQTPVGLRVYGGGILSSMNETIYALESEQPLRKPFDARVALQTSYRIDEIQPVYFVLKSFEQLYELVEIDLMALIHEIHNLDSASPRHPC